MPLPQPHWRPPALPGALAAPRVVEQNPHQGRPAPSTQLWRSPGKPQALFSLPAPRWPVECEVIQETIEHIGERMLQLSPCLTPVPGPCCAHVMSLCPSLSQSGSPLNRSPSAHPWAQSRPQTPLARSRAPLSTTPAQVPEHGQHPWVSLLSPDPFHCPCSPCSAPRLLLYLCSGRGGPRAPLVASSPLEESPGHHAALRVPL